MVDVIIEHEGSILGRLPVSDLSMNKLLQARVSRLMLRCYQKEAEQTGATVSDWLRVRLEDLISSKARREAVQELEAEWRNGQ